MDAIGKLMPKLQIGHLQLLTDNTFEHEQFPWHECIKLKGIGYWLSQRKNFPALQPNIPWLTFAQEHRSEFDVLFISEQESIPKPLIFKHG